MSKNNLILWIIVLAAGAGLIISANIFRDTDPGGDIAIETASTSPFGEANQETITPKPANSSIAASCQLGGEIRFINRNLYETRGAKITYQNVDDPTRQIFWRSEPDDGALTIGPNLFENLPLPSGEREIGVVLSKTTISKSYILTAAITYGVRNSNEDTEVKNANCTGKIIITLP